MKEFESCPKVYRIEFEVSERPTNSVLLFQNPWEVNLSDSFQSYVLREFLLQEDLCNSIYFLGKNATLPFPLFEKMDNVKAIYTGKLPETGEFFTQTIWCNTLYLGVSLNDAHYKEFHNPILLQDLLVSQTFQRNFIYKSFGFYAKDEESQRSLSRSGMECTGDLNPCILLGILDKYLNPKFTTKNELDLLYVYRTDSDLEKGSLITDLGVSDLTVSLEVSATTGEVAKLKLIEDLIDKILRAKIVITSDQNVSAMAMSLGKHVLKGPNLFDNYTLAPEKILDLTDKEDFASAQTTIRDRQFELAKVLRDFLLLESGEKMSLIQGSYRK